jgi:peroxiredoxin
MDALGKNLSTEEQARLTVLAVSSQPVRNPRVSRQILNLSEATRPPLALLVDATHRAFQDFGCYAAQQPLHGLFVIDRDGIIHARYVGPVAFDDPDAVVRALREIDIRANRVSSR